MTAPTTMIGRPAGGLAQPTHTEPPDMAEVAELVDMQLVSPLTVEVVLPRDAAVLVAEIERLTGEPTEDEIDRAARGLWGAWGNSRSTPWSDLDDEDRADMREVARAALRAARGLA